MGEVYLAHASPPYFLDNPKMPQHAAVQGFFRKSLCRSAYQGTGRRRAAIALCGKQRDYSRSNIFVPDSRDESRPLARSKLERFAKQSFGFILRIGLHRRVSFSPTDLADAMPNG